MLDETPRKPYKPLFNRTYLKYMGLIVAIAIVFLSKKAAKPLEQPLAFDATNPSFQVLKQPHLEQQRLFLSFLTQPALRPETKIERELAYASVREQAKKSPVIHSVLWTFDRLELELRWLPQERIELDQILDNFIENSLYGISQEQRKLVIAKHYLQNQAPEELLLNALEQRIALNHPRANSLEDSLHNLKSALLIAPQDVSEQVLANLNQQLSQLSGRYRQSTKAADFPALANWQQDTSTLFANTASFQTLRASQVKPQTNLQSQIDLISHFTLNKLLSRQLKASGISVRLIRKPIFQQGYQVVITSSGKSMADDDVTKKLLATITLDTIEQEAVQVKKQLIEAYRNLVENQDRLFSLYSKKLFYQLETQSSALYEEQLDTISNEQILEQITYLLTANTIVIRLQPNQ